MTLEFDIAGYFLKHYRTGGWAVAKKVSPSIHGHISASLDIGYSKRYCDSYPVLICLKLALNEFLITYTENRLNLVINTTNKYVAGRILKEFKNRERLKNFVRPRPWDHIRDNMIGFNSVVSELRSDNGRFDFLYDTAKRQAEFAAHNNVTPDMEEED